jgi:hypothetical protein
MVDYIKYTPDLANDWWKTWSYVSNHKPYIFERLGHASTKSQLQSKLWIVNELIRLNLKPNKVAILGGWYANYITTLLIEELKTLEVHNYEIDKDALEVSEKFNKRYENKFKTIQKNVMIEPIKEYYDMIINSSCEHMFPMFKFKEINPALNPIYVLQSTSDSSYQDHINCVKSPDELIEQIKLETILYKGSLLLSNGMTRFMVIGK